MSKGLLLVLSGPSGVGKGTVCTALRKRLPHLLYSVSATTRKARLGEQHGVNYFFHTHEQFKQMMDQNKLIEHAEYVGNYYGTPRAYVESAIERGQDIILEIEVKGALQVKKNFPQGIFIFLLPPSLDELKCRIRSRGTENDTTIDHRLLVAGDEMESLDHYDYAVVNDDIDLACTKIESIIVAEHCKVENRL